MPGFETGGNDKYLADDARRWGVRSLGEHAPTEGLLPGRRLVRRQLGAEVRAKAVQLVTRGRSRCCRTVFRLVCHFD